MALTDIVTSSGEPTLSELSRGNVGVVQDVVTNGKNMEEIPAVTGGGGDEIFVLSE